jgi:enoyl-CoA hydratase/carnithine racemase
MKTKEQTLISIPGSPLLFEKVSESYWNVSINNPPFNLFDPEFLDGMEKLVEMARTSADLKVIVFQSSVDDFFLAHFDVVRGKEILARQTKTGVPPWFDVVQELYTLPVISICKVRGRARGIGIEFMAACDLRFGSREKALFGQFEVPSGTIPGGGSMEFLPLIVGRSRALEIIIGGQDFDAGIAELYGLLNRALPDAELDRFVDQLAKRISRFDKGIIGQAKEMISQRAGGMPSMDAFAESRQVFINTAARPYRQAVGKLTREWGIQSNPEFELNLGSYFDALPSGL